MTPSDALPVVVFLHGLAGHGGEWDDVAGRLESTGYGSNEHLANGQIACRWIAPDLPGHGSWFDRVAVAQQPLTADVLVDAALSTVRNAGNGDGRPVVLVGQSMGGLVALRLAARCPELVSHLVLVEADTAALSPASLESFLESLRDWFSQWPASFADADEAMRFFGINRPSSPAWVAGLRSTSDGLVPRFDSKVLVDLMAELAGDGSMVEWRALAARPAPVPCTLVVAEHGTTSESEIASMLDVHPNASVVRILDSGHDAHLDQPAAVADIIAQAVSAASNAKPLD